MSRNLARLARPVSDEVVARVDDVDLSPPDSPARSPRVTFAVGATSSFFLVGPPGSGKTKVLDLLSFRALPYKGRVEMFGIDSARIAPSDRPRMRRRVGLLFQNQGLLPDLDVFANVALAARIARRKAQDYAPEVGELLMWVGLGGRGTEAISRLSDGERRRLCLARALINRPELLIADEPTAGLGDRAERAIMRLIQEVNAAGTPVVVATRDRSVAVNSGSAIYELSAREAY